LTEICFHSKQKGESRKQKEEVIWQINLSNVDPFLSKRTRIWSLYWNSGKGVSSSTSDLFSFLVRHLVRSFTSSSYETVCRFFWACKPPLVTFCGRILLECECPLRDAFCYESLEVDHQDAYYSIEKQALLACSKAVISCLSATILWAPASACSWPCGSVCILKKACQNGWKVACRVSSVLLEDPLNYVCFMFSSGYGVPSPPIFIPAEFCFLAA
jgi:hypothetical protein